LYINFDLRASPSFFLMHHEYHQRVIHEFII
jgi:hypothetical protein